MDPATIAMTIGGAILSAMGGGGGEGQEMQSFSGGEWGLDPRSFLANYRNAINRYGNMYQDLVTQPSRVRATVPSLPRLTGGSLPFTMGGMATDPAFQDPSLLELPGLNFFNPFAPANDQQARDEAAAKGTPMPEAPSSTPVRRSVTARPPQQVVSRNTAQARQLASTLAGAF